MKIPLSILHTEASLGWGGQEIRILTDIRWQIEAGCSVHLAAPPGSGIWNAVEGLNCRRWPLKLSKRSQAGDSLRLIRILRKLQPEWICTHSSVDSWVGLLAARIASPGTLRVRYRHVSTPVATRPQNRWQYRRLATRVITTAECIRQDLLASFDLEPDRIASIPTGVDPPARLPDPAAARRSLCRDLGLSPESRFIGQVSVLRSWKGHTDLIAAFDRVAGALPHHHLILAGDGPQSERLHQVQSTHPLGARIHLPGHVDPVWPVIRALDLAVLASRKNEGIPQSGIQAMGSQVPFVGTRCGGIPELTGSGGERGWLAAPADPASLAAALQAALQPDARVERAFHYARTVFTSERMRNDTLRFLSPG